MGVRLLAIADLGEPWPVPSVQIGLDEVVKVRVDVPVTQVCHLRRVAVLVVPRRAAARMFRDSGTPANPYDLPALF